MNCLFYFAPLHLEPLEAKMVKVIIKPQSPSQLCPGVPARLGVRVHHLPLVLLVLHLEDDDDEHNNDVLLVKYLSGVLEPARQVGLHHGEGDVPPLDKPNLAHSCSICLSPLFNFQNEDLGR